MKTEEVAAYISTFEQVEESPHFEKRSFRVKKKIFFTMDERNATGTVKLTPEEQSAFMAFDGSVIYPASGKWGQSGWTMIDLARVNEDTLADAIRCSYCNAAPKKLADLYRTE